MFDVSWSDPTRETVGQRKSRKELDQSSLASGSQRPPSASSDSTTSKHRPSLLNLFNGSRKDFSRPASRSNLSVPAKEPMRRSSRSSRSRGRGPVEVISPSQELGPGTLSSEKIPDRCVVTELSDTRDRDNFSQSDDPAFASWASRSASTDSTWSSLGDSPRRNNYVQPLSPTSFITQRTEVTVASREDVQDDEQLATVVHISADANVPAVALNLPPQISPSSSTSEFQVPELYPPERGADLSWLQDAMPHPSGRYSVCNVAETSRWKPPGDWECPSIPIVPPKSSARPAWRPDNSQNSLPGSDVIQVQKSLRRMRTARPKIMLERLTEEWSDHGDASIDEELEFEKQLWMRTALHFCTQICTSEEDLRGHSSPLDGGSSSPQPLKTLSLYEDHASLAFLTTLNPFPSAEIHHLSTTTFPSSTVHSLTVPSPKPSLPYAPALFTTIHASLALPALLPSSSLPTLLKECRRLLRRGGSLHLTLIDPCPSAASTGPRMREWLDSHLLLELERNFRCQNPCRLVPGWLAAAGFDAPFTGTTAVTQIPFMAVTAETALAGRSSYPRGAARGPVQEEERNEELKAVVGRRLWEECWGRFCVDVDEEGKGGGGARRWWEDKQIVGECVAMRTSWEALVIVAGMEA